jgi:hypothetical protein
MIGASAELFSLKKETTTAIGKSFEALDACGII